MSSWQPSTTDELDEQLSRPTPVVVRALADCPGDIAVLGAGGKMGFHLCCMLQRGCQESTDPRRIVAVSRFGDAQTRQKFASADLETISADLSQPDDVAALPQVANVFYLAGVKFGTSSDPALLERMNVTAPNLVARHFSESRIVALSTGCVYSFTTPESGGSTEQSETDPPGEYARSCLGRETAFVDAARDQQTRCALVRLNYANEPRYGVLVDIAQRVLSGEPVDLRMGYVNVIWQSDAIAHIIGCLPHTSAPPFVINITGGDVLPVREIAERFAARLDRNVSFTGQEEPTAWLSNAALSHRLLGVPPTALDQMIDRVASWLQRGGETLGKPTHFQTRDGAY